jgi:hypothetical protein
MKKTFALTNTNGKLTCPELVGYELPEIRTARTPIAIEVEMVEVRNILFRALGCVYFTEMGCTRDECNCYELHPATNPDGTVKVANWIFND